MGLRPSGWLPGIAFQASADGADRLDPLLACYLPPVSSFKYRYMNSTPS